jgi:hypothetical protein
MPPQGYPCHRRRVRLSTYSHPCDTDSLIMFSIHDGSLAKAEFENFPIFNLSIPKAVNNVATELLNPATLWSEPAAFKAGAERLAGMFKTAFARVRPTSFSLLSHGTDGVCVYSTRTSAPPLSSPLVPSVKRAYQEGNRTQAFVFYSREVHEWNSIATVSFESLLSPP